MNAHTPGPWRIGDAGNTIFGPPNGTPSPKTIAAIPFKGDGGKENARLIAAAPDLLAACHAFDALWPERNGTIKAMPEVIAVWRAARAAIAKAEGRE